MGGFRVMLAVAIALAAAGAGMVVEAQPARAGAATAAVNVRPDTLPTAEALAGGGNDMRLWSFGDCSRVYPYANSAPYKECVRVVGSDEARDARAYRVCVQSHDKDPVEASRCKAAYRQNRTRAAEDGLVVSTGAAPAAPVSPEVLQRVRLIAANATEEAPVAADPAASPAPPTAAPGETPAAAGAGTVAQTLIDAGSLEPPRTVSVAHSEPVSAVLLVGVALLAALLLGVRMKRGRRASGQY